MPSSVIRHRLGLVQPVATEPASYRPPDTLISGMSLCASGIEMASITTTRFTSLTYPAANRALGYMFCLNDYFLVRKVWWANGTTTGTDSADVAVYTEDGATRLVAAGSTLTAGVSLLQEVDVTDTLLAPGRYWCVYNQNGVTALPLGVALPATTSRAIGWAQMAGAVPLGSTFTPAGIAGAALPYFGIANRTQVA